MFHNREAECHVAGCQCQRFETHPETLTFTVTENIGSSDGMGA
jgi:hypothetical protein